MSGNKISIFRKFLDILRFERAEIWSIYFYAIMYGLVQLTLPLGIQSIISFVLGGSLSTSIVLLIIVVIIGVFLAGLLQVNQMKIIEKIEQQLFVRYAFRYADILPKLELSSVNKHYLPELVNRFFDTVSLQKGISKLLLDIPTATIQILFGLILLSFYHPAFIFFGILLLIVLFLILRTTGSRGLETSIDKSTYKYHTAAYLQEIGRAIISFKFSRNKELHLRSIDEHSTNYLKSSTNHFKVLLLQYWTLIGLKVLITAAMLIVGSYLLLHQQLNIGQFIAAEIVILLVINSVEKLIVNLDQVYEVLTSVEKLSKVTDKPEEEKGKHLLEASKGLTVRAKAVDFAYDNRSFVLKNLNFEISSGDKVCVIGNNNSGKSTLLKLICGLYPTTEGSLLINDVPVDNYSVGEVRSKVSTFFNDRDELFYGTINENVCMGEDVSFDRLDELSRVLNFKEFVDSHKEGYEYMLKPTGQGLSSITAKKILLMRALISKSELILLENPWEGLQDDEATKLQEYILNDLVDSTVMVITDDGVFAEKSNKVLELKNGTITA